MSVHLLPLLLTACFSVKDTAPLEDTGDTAAGEALPAGFESELEDQGGCADVVLYAWKPDDTLAMFFRTEGVAEAAHTAGEATSFSWSLPDPALSLHVERGEHLTHITCGDVLEYETVVEASWQAVSGEVQLTVTPTGDATDWGEYPSLGELELTDIVFEPEAGGASTPLSSFFISSGIGWLPG